MAEATKVFTVSELNLEIRRIIEAQDSLAHCYVTGEISNFKHHSSGHMYFTLKDDKSRIRAVMFASRAKHLAFMPEDGMRVIVTGSIGVFDRDGQYQIYVDDMQPDGVGALYVAFTQLKEKLESEGMFHPSRKKPLPGFPKRVGVVTSPTGAVIRDICSTLRRRYPLAQVVLSPALVQGPTAAATIVAGIERLIRSSQEIAPIDVIIVARGGGSLEELWPFNEEAVARAIAACEIPVVSAVGHETDYTICDFVADVRAATPTAAAELVAPYVQDMRMQLNQWALRVDAALRYRVSQSRQRLQNISESSVMRQPLQIVNLFRQNVDYLDSQIQQRATKPIRLGQRAVAALSERLYRIDMGYRIATTKNRLGTIQNRLEQQARRKTQTAGANLERLCATLEALNPLHVLRRGYSIVYQSDGTSVVSSVESIKAGDRISIRVADGQFSARVETEEDTGDESGVQARLNI